MLVGGASLAIIGSYQKVTAAGPGEAGVLQVVSEPILEVTWACAGQGLGHVVHGTCNLEWSTAWHMCRHWTHMRVTRGDVPRLGC